MGAVARERQQHPARWCLTSSWHGTAYNRLGSLVFTAMGLQWPFQEGQQFRDQSPLAWTAFVAAQEEGLDSQKSTVRWNLETDSKEKCLSVRRCEDTGDTTKCTHCLAFPGDDGAKATSLAMPA